MFTRPNAPVRPPVDDAASGRPQHASRRRWPRGPRIGAILVLLFAVAFAIAGMVRPDLLPPLRLGRSAGSGPVAVQSSPGSARSAGASASPGHGDGPSVATTTEAIDPFALTGGRRAVAMARSGQLLDRYVQAVTPVGGDAAWPCRTTGQRGTRLARNGVLKAEQGDGCPPALAWSRALFPSAAASLGIALSARVMAAGSSTGVESGTPATGVSGGIVAASVGVATPAAVGPAITAAHPRMILDLATLTTLRQRVTANTAQWQALKSTCDNYIGGNVEYPDGNAYPDKPNVGSGYQGEDYLPALLSEAMCYQVLRTTNASQAATYGAKAVDILVKMSSPYGSGGHGTDPCTDSGYGIRFYGVGFGLGYDWLYDLLSASQRSQVYTTANAWLTAWEQAGGCADFEYAHPQSNYFAGYFHAKAVIAIGTYGENPSAPTEWDDWYGNQFTARVLPYYRLHLAGGGWPEGFANYATLGIQNMSLPAREVKTATGVDLVHATTAYTYPTDNAAYLMHFTWPSRGYVDDRDTNRSSGSSPDPGTAPLGLFQQVLGEAQYWGSSLAPVLRQYAADVSTATAGFSPAPPWLAFLEVDPSGSTTAVNTLPLSYLASGMSAVSARSDWTKTAVWMSFRAGPYVNNPGQGEEYYDQGSLALVRGATPLLLNASGWLVHDPNGSADEGHVYDDNYGSFNGTPYLGNRQIYNVFYVRNMSGSTVLNAYGQDANTTEGNGVRTAVTAYEDGSDYVYLRATHLEDMYRASGGSLGQGVSAWSREVTYLRPGRFVVHDRTSASSASLDQYMAWHFPASPTKQATAAGGARFDVTYGGTYAGAMTAVTPVNPVTTTLAMYPASSPTKAWQVQVRPAAAATSNQWLTVFDLSASSAAVATASPVTVNQGSVVGVRLAASDGVSVVINSSGTPGTPLSGTIAYYVPAEAAHHLVTELGPFTGYSITTAAQGSGRVVTITPGGTFTSSGKGVLDFYVSGSGAVQLSKPAYVTLPISTIPVGDPTPYTPGG